MTVGLGVRSYKEAPELGGLYGPGTNMEVENHLFAGRHLSRLFDGFGVLVEVSNLFPIVLLCQWALCGSRCFGDFGANAL